MRSCLSLEFLKRISSGTSAGAVLCSTDTQDGNARPRLHTPDMAPCPSNLWPGKCYLLSCRTTFTEHCTIHCPGLAARSPSSDPWCAVGVLRTTRTPERTSTWNWRIRPKEEVVAVKLNLTEVWVSGHVLSVQMINVFKSLSLTLNQWGLDFGKPKAFWKWHGSSEASWAFWNATHINICPQPLGLPGSHVNPGGLLSVGALTCQYRR